MKTACNRGWWWRLLAGGATALLLAGVASAYDTIKVDGQDVRWARARIPVPYFIGAAGSDDIAGDSDIQAVQDSFQTWQDVDCAYIAFAYQGLAENPQATMYDTTNYIYWIERNWPSDMGSGTIGVTTPAMSNYGTIEDADIRFNGQDFSWSTSGNGWNTMDVANIATHEIGHFFGLGHSSLYEATMYPEGSYGETRLRSLSQDDINGVCFLYPESAGGIGTPCSSGADCNYSVCAWQGTRQICSQSCTLGATECSAGFSCVDQGGEAGACIPSATTGGGGGNGGLCDSCADGADCNTGMCVQATAETVCTQICDPNNSNCPTGYGCYNTDSGDGVCYPVSGSCEDLGGGTNPSAGAEGSPCGQTGSCESGLVCVGTSAQDALCRKTCNFGPADCPQDYTCAQLSDGTNVLDYGACIPGSAVPQGGDPGLNQECISKCQDPLICVTAGTIKVCKHSCDPLADYICNDGSLCLISSEGYGYCGLDDLSTDGGTPPVPGYPPGNSGPANPGTGVSNNLGRSGVGTSDAGATSLNSDSGCTCRTNGALLPWPLLVLLYPAIRRRRRG